MGVWGHTQAFPQHLENVPEVDLEGVTGPPRVDPGLTAPEDPEKDSRVIITLDVDTTYPSLTCQTALKHGPSLPPLYR